MKTGGDQWNDAELKQPIIYARASKLLRLPDDVRAALPNSI